MLSLKPDGGGITFHVCYFDLDPMALIYELGLYTLKIPAYQKLAF